MWVLFADDKPIYAATDETRFWRHAAKFATATNVRAAFVTPTGAHAKARHAA